MGKGHSRGGYQGSVKLRFCAESQEGKTLPACGMSTIGVIGLATARAQSKASQVGIEAWRGIAGRRSFGDWGATQAAKS